jgi:hypothetical protein
MDYGCEDGCTGVRKFRDIFKTHFVFQQLAGVDPGMRSWKMNLSGD